MVGSDDKNLDLLVERNWSAVDFDVNFFQGLIFVSMLLDTTFSRQSFCLRSLIALEICVLSSPICGLSVSSMQTLSRISVYSTDFVGKIPRIIGILPDRTKRF